MWFTKFLPSHHPPPFLELMVTTRMRNYPSLYHLPIWLWLSGLFCQLNSLILHFKSLKHTLLHFSLLFSGANHLQLMNTACTHPYQVKTPRLEDRKLVAAAVLSPVLTVEHHPLHILLQCWQWSHARLSGYARASGFVIATAAAPCRSVLLRLRFHVESGSKSSQMRVISRRHCNESRRPVENMVMQLITCTSTSSPLLRYA